MSIAPQSATAFQLYKRLLKEVKPYAWMFVFGLIGTAAVSGIDAGLAWMIKPIINQGFIERDRHFIQLLPMLIVLVFIVRGGGVFISNYCIARVGRQVVMDFRQQILPICCDYRLASMMLSLPASYFPSLFITWSRWQRRVLMPF